MRRRLNLGISLGSGRRTELASTGQKRSARGETFYPLEQANRGWKVLPVRRPGTTKTGLRSAPRAYREVILSVFLSNVFETVYSSTSFRTTWSLFWPLS